MRNENSEFKRRFKASNVNISDTNFLSLADDTRITLSNVDSNCQNVASDSRHTVLRA